MRGNRMVVNYLKALPSVMAWIFLSSATMSSISCNSYIWVPGVKSQENFFAATFSTTSPFLRSLSNTFLASSTLPTCTSHLENSSRKVLIKDSRPHQGLIVSLPWWFWTEVKPNQKNHWGYASQAKVILPSILHLCKICWFLQRRWHLRICEISAHLSKSSINYSSNHLAKAYHHLERKPLKEKPGRLTWKDAPKKPLSSTGLVSAM